MFVSLLCSDVEQRKRISVALEEEVREGIIPPLYAERAVPWTIVSGEYVESAAASRKAACWVDPNPHNRTYEPWWTDAEWQAVIAHRAGLMAEDMHQSGQPLAKAFSGSGTLEQPPS